MSIRWIQWAFAQDTASSGERLVLIALADHAVDDDDDLEHDGLCWPSVATIARKAALADRQVRDHLNALVDRGLLLKLSRRRGDDGGLRAWNYRLNPTGGGVPVGDSPSGGGAPFLPAVDRRAEPSVEPSKRSKTLALRKTSDSAFDEFWRAYPKHADKGHAEKAWKKLSVDDRALAIDAASRYATLKAGKDPMYTKNPATWLNGKCWLDEDLPQVKPAVEDDDTGWIRLDPNAPIPPRPERIQR